MLLENMVEEEGEDLFGGKYPSHRDLWVQFANGLGIARDDITNYEPLPGIRAALEMYVSLVKQSHWAVAIGTGLVFEGGGPETDERGKRSAGEILSVDSRRLVWIFFAPTNTTTKAMATWWSM